MAVVVLPSAEYEYVVSSPEASFEDTTLPAPSYFVELVIMMSPAVTVSETLRPAASYTYEVLTGPEIPSVSFEDMRFRASRVYFVTMPSGDVSVSGPQQDQVFKIFVPSDEIVALQAMMLKFGVMSAGPEFLTDFLPQDPFSDSIGGEGRDEGAFDANLHFFIDNNSVWCPRNSME